MDQLQEEHPNFSLDELKKAVGGIISFLKSELESADFEKIKNAIPQADELVQQAEEQHAKNGKDDPITACLNLFCKKDTDTNNEKEGGDDDDVKERAEGDATAAGTTGSSNAEASPINSMTQLLAYLNKAGIDPKQIMQFLPAFASFLQNNANIDVSSIIGTPNQAAAVTNSASTTPPSKPEEADPAVPPTPTNTEVNESTAGTATVPPVPAETTTTTSSTTTTDNNNSSANNNNNNQQAEMIGNLMNQAQGFLSSFGKK